MGLGDVDGDEVVGTLLAGAEEDNGFCFAGVLATVLVLAARTGAKETLVFFLGPALDLLLGILPRRLTLSCLIGSVFFKLSQAWHRFKLAPLINVQ